nr:hypothetical protein [Terribacillus saccharophilus]
MQASLSNKVGEKADTAASKLENIKENKSADVHEKAQASADKLGRNCLVGRMNSKTLQRR